MVFSISDYPEPPTPCDCKYEYTRRPGGGLNFVRTEECFRCSVKNAMRVRREKERRLLLWISMTAFGLTELILLWQIGFVEGWW